MNKKAIAILGVIFLLIVGTLGFLIYQKYSTKPSTSSATPANSVSQTNNQSQNQPATTTPVAVSDTFVKLSTSQVLSPTLFYNGNGITYFTPAGDLYQADLVSDAKSATLSRQRTLGIKQKTGINKILWPAAGNNFIAESDTPVASMWSFFNSQIGDYVDLPPQVESVDWMPAGDKIAYVWLQNNKATLNISDPDMQNYKSISDMWETDDSIHVSPDGLSILYYETHNSSTTNPIYMVSIDGKVWKTPITADYNSGVLWSPDSKKFLFGKKDPSSGKFQLWYYNVMTSETKSLGVYTIPQKAAWGSDSLTIYAAVPTVGTPGIGSLTQDTIYKITTDTLQQKQYSSQSQQVDGEDLFADQDGTKLFLKNAQDNYLYYVDLTR